MVSLLFDDEARGRSDKDLAARFAEFHASLLDSGVLFPPSPHATFFVSSAHTIAMIDYTVDVLRKAVAGIAV